MTNRPLYTASQAVDRALAAVGHMTYELGTGDCDTPLDGKSDCVFALVYCYGLRRHRPGYNANVPGHHRIVMGPDGPAPSVVDDINCNSEIEDGLYMRELVTEVTGDPEPGDILAWPTIVLRNPDGSVRFRGCGHNGIVVGVDRIHTHGAWNPSAPDYSLLDVVQCCGPNGHRPGVIKSDGSAWRWHTSQWELPEHRSRILRVVP